MNPYISKTKKPTLHKNSGFQPFSFIKLFLEKLVICVFSRHHLVSQKNTHSSPEFNRKYRSSITGVSAEAELIEGFMMKSHFSTDERNTFLSYLLFLMLFFSSSHFFFYFRNCHALPGWSYFFSVQLMQFPSILPALCKEQLIEPFWFISNLKLHDRPLFTHLSVFQRSLFNI